MCGPTCTFWGNLTPCPLPAEAAARRGQPRPRTGPGARRARRAALLGLMQRGVFSMIPPCNPSYNNKTE
jgi:hypothetical protein